MRRLFRLTATFAILAAAACSKVGVDDPTGPRTTLQELQAITTAGCTPKTAAEIEALISDLFFKNDWPDPNSALSKFNAVKALLAGGSTQEAQFKTRDLVRFIENKFGNLTPAQQANTRDEMDTLVKELYCFVGISGIVYDLNPGDPAKAFATPGGTGGVWFPANSVPVGTMVVIQDITDQYNCPVGSGPLCGTSPLNTPLDKYPTYIAIQLIPDHAFTPPALPVVAVCFPGDTPLDVADDLLVGHQGDGGFEILPEATIPGELLDLLNCPELTAQQSAPSGVLARLLAPIANAFLPRQLHARVRFGFGGAGGSAEEFSPFGAVDVSLAGAGGSAEEFSRAGVKTPVPMASVIINATPTVTGAAGTTATTGLPKVTVMTRGQDDDGANPIAGVKVVFSVKAAAGSSPAGNAHLCTVNGVTPTQVEVLTNSNGEATLPCFDFGTTVGYNNIKANFDPSSLTFPGAGQVTVLVNGSADNSVNFLSHTDPGPAAAVNTWLPTSAPVASATYAYGNGVEGAAVADAPRVRVTDAFGNAVGGVAVTWSPLSAANGALAVVGSGAQTDAGGLARIDSWTLGAGANQLTAEIAGSVTPATFTASTPTGQALFACAVGGSKTDIGWMTFPKPAGTIREITLFMSVTGQASTEATYEAAITVLKNGPTGTGTPVGSGAGGVVLPGNNGSPRAITFRLSDPVTPTELGTGQSTIWFNLTFSNLPATRKMQVWYNNAITKSNQGPCYESKVYAPGSTTTFKRGLGINVTN